MNSNGKQRVFSDPKVYEIVKFIKDQWGKDTPISDMWPSQVELLVAFSYWMHVEMINSPIKNLYLYPCCGATTLWMHMEKIVKEIVLLPAQTEMLRRGNYSIEFSYITIFKESDVLSSLRNKILIIDNFASVRSETPEAIKRPHKLLDIGVKGVVLS